MPTFLQGSAWPTGLTLTALAYLPKHQSKGTARMKLTKETAKEGKKRSVCMERSKTDTIKMSPDDLSLPNKKKIIINILW